MRGSPLPAASTAVVAQVDAKRLPATTSREAQTMPVQRHVMPIDPTLRRHAIHLGIPLRRANPIQGPSRWIDKMFDGFTSDARKVNLSR